MIIKNNARACAAALLVAVLVGESAYAQGSANGLTGPKARSTTAQKSAGLAQQIAIAISDLSFDTLQSNISVTTTERSNMKQNTTWSGIFYWKRSEDDDRWFRVKFKDSGPDILVKGVEVKVYVPKINKIIETNLQTVIDKYPMYYFDPTEMLTGNYDLKLLPKRGGYTAIKAVPREPGDTEYIIMSVTRVNGNYFPAKFEIVQKTMTRTIVLSNVKQPEEIADSLFQLNYPNAASMPIK